jgi:hypothetical protein
VVLAWKLAVDVRPELLQDVRRRVHSKLNTELGDNVAGCSAAGGSRAAEIATAVQLPAISEYFG